MSKRIAVFLRGSLLVIGLFAMVEGIALAQQTTAPPIDSNNPGTDAIIVQASPPPLAPASVPASPVAAPTPGAKKRQPITLGLKPIIQWNTGGDVNPVRNDFYPIVLEMLGWHIGYDVTNRLTVSWDRSAAGALNGRYYAFTSAGKCCSTTPTYTPVAYDLVDFFGATYQATRNFSVALGYSRRWRIFSIGAGAAGSPGNTNPAFWSGASLIANWGLGPDTIVGRPVTLIAYVVDTDHRANAAAITAFHAVYPGAVVPGWQIVCYLCGVSVKFPIFHQTFFVPKFNYWAVMTNYTNNLIYPGTAHAVEAGFDLNPAKWVTINMTYRNFNSIEYGYPFPTPQDQHYTYVNLSAYFRTRFGI